MPDFMQCTITDAESIWVPPIVMYGYFIDLAVHGVTALGAYVHT